MSAKADVTLLRLTPILGFLTFMESSPLDNYRVVSIQLNGFPVLSYPLIYVAELLQSFGIGLVVFGLSFAFTPNPPTAFRKTEVSSAFVGASVPFMYLSAIGFLANIGEHLPLWSIETFSVIGSVGVALIIGGFSIRGVKWAGLVSASLHVTVGIIVSVCLFWAVLVITLGPLFGGFNPAILLCFGLGSCMFRSL